MAKFVHNHIFSLNYGVKLTNWFKKCFDGWIFSNPAIHRMGNATNILCSRCKELINLRFNLASLLLLNWGQRKTSRETWNTPLNYNGKLNVQSELIFSGSAVPVALLMHGVNAPLCGREFGGRVCGGVCPGLCRLLVYGNGLLFGFAAWSSYGGLGLGLGVSWGGPGGRVGRAVIRGVFGTNSGFRV